MLTRRQLLGGAAAGLVLAALRRSASAIGPGSKFRFGHLQLGTGGNDGICRAGARDEARPRLDAMRILQRGGRDVDLHLVAAQLLRESAPLWHGRKDAQRGVRGKRGSEKGRQDDSNECFHAGP